MKKATLIPFHVVAYALFMWGFCYGGRTINVGHDALICDFTDIQAAIDYADHGDRIVVAPGTYLESINFLGKAIRLVSRDGADKTVIDGTGYFNVVRCVSGEGPDTVLEGFTITGGNANDDDSLAFYGGGMYNDQSSPTVIDCVFRENQAVYGGGMYNYQCSPAIIGCRFIGNQASGGGAIYNKQDSNPTIINCVFNENTAFTLASGNGGLGGGIRNQGSSPIVTHCYFSKNSGWEGGGMFSDDDSYPVITGCVFSENSAVLTGGGISNEFDSDAVVRCCIFYKNSALIGGGMYNVHSNPVVMHCTFSDNLAEDDFYGGGAIYNYYCDLTVVNSILWGNRPDSLGNVESSLTISYTTIQGESLWPGTGNINADPLFVEAAGGNLRLMRGSPCIDAGDNTAVPEDIATDLNGWSRFIDDLCTTNTGSGTGAIADMGAYEFLPADIDGSGRVNFADFSAVAAHWDQSEGDLAGADMNCDGVVELADAALLVTWWLEGI